ncbi:uncharacterized protein LOC135394032 [Ornithodoros turicata]|uniref:uncharacterized protein LOC135394032 n=1 Tax=Ornithodoros turicata TaxID=34597 RepID=UPI003139D355
MRGYHSLQVLLLVLLLCCSGLLAARDAEDPMDAYLLSDAMDSRGEDTAESVAKPSKKLQLLPFGTRLKPPKAFVVPQQITSTPSPRGSHDAEEVPTSRKPKPKPRPTIPPGLFASTKRVPRIPVPTRQPRAKAVTRRTPARTVPPKLIASAKLTPAPRPTPVRTVPPTLVASTKPTPAPRLRVPAHLANPKTKNPAYVKTGKAYKYNKDQVQKRKGVTGSNPKPQASFFFTNVGPNHFEYRGVFDANALPVHFNGDPQAFLQLIPQLPRLFEDPFPPPPDPNKEGLPPQLLLGAPPPKEPPSIPPPPPPPLTFLQPVVNILPQPSPPKNTFPQYDYVLGGRLDGEHPRIFKFNDERISILEFERSKREGRFSRRRGGTLDPERIPRKNFLIFHGGHFPARVNDIENNSVFGQREPRTQFLSAFQPAPPPPPPPTPQVYLPVNAPIGKVKPGGFVYFIRT